MSTSGTRESDREEPYLVPAQGLHRVEEVVRRSRFIASISRASDPGSARAFAESIRAELPDATHHCWAFVAGAPGTTTHIGLSDAGEPHGTAGRPILNTLLHSEVGEIVAVVTRYFGGVKLGKGGLGRAYAGSVARALETLQVTERISSKVVLIRVPFAAADALFRLLSDIGASRTEERYGSEVEVTARVPLAVLDRLDRKVAGFTSGRGAVEVIEEGG